MPLQLLKDKGLALIFIINRCWRILTMQLKMSDCIIILPVIRICSATQITTGSSWDRTLKPTMDRGLVPQILCLLLISKGQMHQLLTNMINLFRTWGIWINHQRNIQMEAISAKWRISCLLAPRIRALKVEESRILTLMISLLFTSVIRRPGSKASSICLARVASRRQAPRRRPSGKSGELFLQSIMMNSVIFHRWMKEEHLLGLSREMLWMKCSRLHQ